VTFESLIVDRAGAVATVTINRPAVLNALDGATIDELDRCIGELSTEATTRVIVLTGAGERAFIAGADIKELAAMTPTSAREVARRGQAMCDRIERCGRPVIAAINGVALGGGCEVAMACAIRVAADTARIGQPEINLGLIPGFGGTQRLPRLVGPGRALELLLSGESLDAHAAERVGLINRVVPAGDLRRAVMDLAEAVSAKPPRAVSYVLDAVRSGLQMTLHEGCGLEATLFGLVTATEDMREGTQAFLDKRRAVFRGR